METSSKERLKLSQDGIFALRWMLSGESPGFRFYAEMIESEDQEILERGFGELVEKNKAHAYGGLYGCGDKLELYGDEIQQKKWLQEALDSNVNPDHYQNGGSGIEAYKVLEFLSFHDGNAAKYLMRLGKKDVTVQELKKSEWYILHYIDLLENYEVHLREWEQNVYRFQKFADESPDATDVDRIVSLLLSASSIGGNWLTPPVEREPQLMILRDALKLVQARIDEVQEA